MPSTNIAPSTSKLSKMTAAIARVFKVGKWRGKRVLERVVPAVPTTADTVVVVLREEGELIASSG